MAAATPKTGKGKVRRKPDVPGITRPMTYEEYMAGPEEMARYDIIDGWKVYRLYGEKQLPNPTREHQRIQGRLQRKFQDFETQMHLGQVIAAPCDVQVTYQPIRNRQPDLLFISNARLAENPSDDPAPLSPAPELVVEIVSPSDKPAVLAAKIAYYRAVDVQEAWVIRAAAQTVEVLRLSVEEIETIGTYGRGQTILSRAFPDLRVLVDDIFTAS